MLQQTLHLHDEAGTMALGAAFARALVPGLVVYLHGDLGAGKTTLTRSLLHASGWGGHVKSPTYTLAEPYQIELHGHPQRVMHFDLYRMGSPEEFIEAGFRDDFDGQTICFIEWPEKGAPLLPEPDIELTITLEGDGRRIVSHARTERGLQCLQQLNFAPNL